MEISCLRQAANAQLSLASSRSSVRRGAVLDSVRGLPRLRAVKLRATGAVAALDSSKNGDGASRRFEFGGGKGYRFQEASLLLHRALERGAWSARMRAGNEVGSTVDASAGQGVFHSVPYLCPLSFFSPLY